MPIEREIRMIDIIQSDRIEVINDGRFLWINVDGVCRFRASLERCKDFSIKYGIWKELEDIDKSND